MAIDTHTNSTICLLISVMCVEDAAKNITSIKHGACEGKQGSIGAKN